MRRCSVNWNMRLPCSIQRKPCRNGTSMSLHSSPGMDCISLIGYSTLSISNPKITPPFISEDVRCWMLDVSWPHAMSAPTQIKSQRDLIVWQKVMDFVESVYAATPKFPKEKKYALTSQLRRAVVSAPSNIAEGQGRASNI